MTDAVAPAPKKSNLWQKGQSGNPKGRPKGSKNQISLVKLMVEGELRARMQPRMGEVVEEILRQALAGDREMLKLLFKSWVSGTKASDEEPTKEKIQIVIGKLDQVPPVSGRVVASDSITTEE